MGDVLTGKMLREAVELVRNQRPRCEGEDGRLHHVVSPRELRELEAGALRWAVCANCGGIVLPEMAR